MLTMLPWTSSIMLFCLCVPCLFQKFLGRTCEKQIKTKCADVFFFFNLVIRLFNIKTHKIVESLGRKTE